MSRIKLTRDELLTEFIEVGQPPEVLQEKFAKAPFCHLLSTYVIRPVACDQLPFFIHHKNKQPIFMQEKKVRRETGTKQVDGFSSSDDEFETVKTEKKIRGQKTQATEADLNPAFPASDPSKVKVIAPSTGKKLMDKKQSKMNVTEEESKLVRPTAPAKEQQEKPKEEAKAAPLTRPATAKKEQAPKKEQKKQTNDYFGAAMKQVEQGGAKDPQSQAPKVEEKKQAPSQQANTGKKGKKQNKEEEKAPVAAPVAAPKKEASKKPEVNKQPQAQPAANDFMAQLAAGAAKTQAQDEQKKINKQKRRQGQKVAEPEYAKTNFGNQSKQSGFGGLYD